jgi:hypothetical protein
VNDGAAAGHKERHGKRQKSKRSKAHGSGFLVWWRLPSAASLNPFDADDFQNDHRDFDARFGARCP